jgi:hypothetical protein
MSELVGLAVAAAAAAATAAQRSVARTAAAAGLAGDEQSLQHTSGGAPALPLLLLQTAVQGAAALWQLQHGRQRWENLVAHRNITAAAVALHSGGRAALTALCCPLAAATAAVQLAAALLQQQQV